MRKNKIKSMFLFGLTFVLLSNCMVNQQNKSLNYTINKGVCLNDSILNGVYPKCKEYLVTIKDTFSLNSYVKTNSLELFFKKSQAEKKIDSNKSTIAFELNFSNDSIRIENGNKEVIYNGVITNDKSGKGLSKIIALGESTFYKIVINRKFWFSFDTETYHFFRLLKQDKELVLIKSNRKILYQ
jgi:hypothetical protein